MSPQQCAARPRERAHETPSITPPARRAVAPSCHFFTTVGDPLGARARLGSLVPAATSGRFRTHQEETLRVQRRTATATAALAAAGLALTTVAAGPASADSNPNTAQKMAKAVTVKAVHKHLEAFQKIADENGGNRGAGTSGYNAS